MSYMMEFPPSKAKMPQGQGPPHVRFAINDVETTNELPTNIPAALVFHFAPALRKWVLPETKPGPGLVNQALLSPFVAINITEDIEVEGLGWILAKMAQIANIKSPVPMRNLFMLNPSIMVCVSIHKAWKVLEINMRGLDALYIHLQTTLLMLGPPVTLFEIKGLWHTFPTESPILQHMAQNFVRHYIARSYTPYEASEIRHWYLETTARWTFFKKFERQSPDFEKVMLEALKASRERLEMEELQTQQIIQAESDARATLTKDKGKQVLSAQKSVAEEIADWEKQAVQKRKDRTLSTSSSRSSSRSSSSVKTVIHRPQDRESSRANTRATGSTARRTREASVTRQPSLSFPVDGNGLTEMLENLEIRPRIEKKEEDAQMETVIRGPQDRESSRTNNRATGSTARRTREASGSRPSFRSFPVDSNTLTEMLENLAIQRHIEDEEEDAQMEADPSEGSSKATSSNADDAVHANPFQPEDPFMWTCFLGKKFEETEGKKSEEMGEKKPEEMGGEKFEEMGYVSPGSATAIGKLKLKDNLETIPPDGNLKPRQFGMGAETQYHGELVESALAAAAGALPSSSKVKEKDGSSQLPGAPGTLLATESLSNVSVESGESAHDEPRSHEQVLTEMKGVIETILQRNADDGDDSEGALTPRQGDNRDDSEGALTPKQGDDRDDSEGIEAQSQGDTVMGGTDELEYLLQSAEYGGPH